MRTRDGSMLEYIGRRLVFLMVIAALPTSARAQGGLIPGRAEVEALLLERGGISMTLPDLGYVLEEGAVKGTLEAGSLRVTHEKMFYFFVHWGPIEVEAITEDYVRERIPQIWPSEGLRVVSTRAAAVAGHPAVYAEVRPARGFYSAHFLIWNCPETGRQFIADMNYNTDLRTPRQELEDQIQAVTQTLACHEGAPTRFLKTHPISFESRRFGVGFDHPPDWFVQESPYGVPHPAYRGVRDRTVGSLLAWPEDRPVVLSFQWKPGQVEREEGRAGMVGSVRQFQRAVEVAGGMEGVGSFHPQASEALTISGHQVLKVLGRVVKDAPGENPDQGAEEAPERARMMVLVAEGFQAGRDLVMTVSLDDYSQNGAFHQVDREVFDRWGQDLLEGLFGEGP